MRTALFGNNFFIFGFNQGDRFCLALFIGLHDIDAKLGEGRHGIFNLV